MMAKRICVLGSTGSIGTQTLDLCAALGYSVTGLAAGRDVDLLARQIRLFAPEFVAVADEDAAQRLRFMTGTERFTLFSGADAAARLARECDADLFVNAMGGICGLLPSIEVARRPVALATANKESIVAGGDLIFAEAKQSACRILPIDSEHSAIFQVLQGDPNDPRYLKRLIITASGGPFRGKDPNDLWEVSPEEAARHPIWKMGKKVSVDSATLMNKGLELIEAARLFCVPEDRITIALHPQSVIHSLAEFCDGAILAQMGTPDMHTCIKFALTYPARADALNLPLDLTHLSLELSETKEGEYPMVDLAREALRRGGASPCILNAADEAAVSLFLQNKIRFPEIFSIVRETFETTKAPSVRDARDLLELDSSIKASISQAK